MVYRILLTRVDLHEMDYAEVAEAWNIAIGTVKSLLARARLKMSEKLCNTKTGNIAYMIQRKD